MRRERKKMDRPQMKGLALSGVALIVLCCSVPALAFEAQEPAIQARVDFATVSEWFEFVTIEDLDLMNAKPGEYAVIVTDQEQLEELRSLGFKVTVEIEHMQEYYAARIRGDNFGAFHTFSETVEFLDDLHASYPSITTDKMQIGTSHEGREIWAIKVSDNPGIDEDEPEVLFDGIHHAREPMAVEVIIYFLTWLCENYGTDEEATFLIDNREMWFVPVVNPDGYVYNELTNPGGGGMWRKNRRDNAGSSCWGVDNNRNYTFHWGGSGSSGDPCSNTYRGPSAGSEPENQATMNLMIAHEFVCHISFHSVMGAIVLPWSWTCDPSPHDALLHDWGDGMAMYNGYQVGTSCEILYLAAGSSKDYAYGEQEEKNMIFSCTLEVGGSGFWPYESEIPDLNEDCLWSQIYNSRVAGVYLELLDTTLSGGNGDQKPDPGETLGLVLDLENQALFADATNVQMTLRTDDAYIQLHDASASVGTIAARGTGSNSSDPFSFTVDPSTPDGHGLVMVVEIDADGYHMEKRFDWLVGTPVALFSDDMESGTGEWIENDGRWGLTTSSYHSPTQSYTDSPSGNYSSNINTWIELRYPLDLSQVATADLSFWHKYDTEGGYDFCYVEASTDGGTTWHQVGVKYHGTIYSWQEVELSLGDYVGTDDFKVRFRLKSDSYVTDDGWYVDDVLISGPPTGNTIPTAPTLSSPPNGGAVGTGNPTLVVNNSYDPDPGDVLTYGFLVYSDEYFTNLVRSTSGIPEGSGTTSWMVDVTLGDGTYWWRAFSDDGTDRSPLMEGASFIVESTGVDEELTRLALLPARPNPFAREAELSFELPVRQAARLAVYSVQGQLVRTLVDGDEGPGRVHITWDGRDEAGRRVGSGLYLMKLEAGAQERHGKVLVLR